MGRDTPAVGQPFCARRPVRKHGRMSIPAEPRSGRDVIAQFLPQSPWVAKLGIVAEVLDPDQVRLQLPWDPSNDAIDNMVHGGAIATLAECSTSGCNFPTTRPTRWSPR
jgi:acyl-coenzyme A thioesterase PaaI-like protein